MRLRPEEVDRICKKILIKWKSVHLVRPKVPEEKVLKKMVDVFLGNLQEEDRINQQAEKMMAQLERQTRGQDIDQRKMLLMIKKQLAKEKGFIL